MPVDPDTEVRDEVEEQRGGNCRSGNPAGRGARTEHVTEDHREPEGCVDEQHAVEGRLRRGHCGRSERCEQPELQRDEPRRAHARSTDRPGRG